VYAIIFIIAIINVNFMYVWGLIHCLREFNLQERFVLRLMVQLRAQMKSNVTDAYLIWDEYACFLTAVVRHSGYIPS